MSQSKEHGILFKAEMVRAILSGQKTQTRRLIDWSRAYLLLSDNSRASKGLLSPEGYPIVDIHLARMIKVPWDDISLKSLIGSAPYAVGDHLWVRETWRPIPGYTNWDFTIRYHADGYQKYFPDDGTLFECPCPKAASRGNVSPLFMPRLASRITLEVTNVRAEPLQNISHDDAISEGIEDPEPSDDASLSGGYGIWRDYSVAPENNEGYNYCRTPQESFKTLWDSINVKRGIGFDWDSNPWVWVYEFKVLEQLSMSGNRWGQVPDSEGQE